MTPLIWDLTAFVEAKSLPWSHGTRRRLTRHVDKIPATVNVAMELGRAPLRNVIRLDWDSFKREYRSTVRWSRRVGIIDDHDVSTFFKSLDDFLPLVDTERVALAHGDYNPTNIMFQDDATPWLIDFDDLIYATEGNSLGRLLSCSFSETAWRKKLVDELLPRTSDFQWRSIVAFTVWHSMREWQHRLNDLPSHVKATSLEEIEDEWPLQARTTRSQISWIRQFLAESAL